MSGSHSAPQHHQVFADTEMKLVSIPGGLPVTASLCYTTRDPLAVTMVFAAAGCSPVRWVFSRELLVTGMGRPAGVGDVHVFPAGDNVVLDLSTPDGSARLVADSAILARFVAQTLVAVPTGCEMAYLDLDHELSLLCGAPLPQSNDA